jgi:uncharacterized membrane protein
MIGGMQAHRTSSDAEQSLVGVSFDTPHRAQEFLVAAGGLAAAGSLKLKDAVTVSKDEHGNTTARETIDPSPGRAALSGAMWSGLFGLILGGPVGWVAGLAVGAGAGAVSAKVIDLGIPDEWVQWFREAVRPGTVTVVLLVEDLDRNALVQEVSRFSGAELVHATFDELTISRLREALGEHPDETEAG